MTPFFWIQLGASSLIVAVTTTVVETAVYPYHTSPVTRARVVNYSVGATAFCSIVVSVIGFIWSF